MASVKDEVRASINWGRGLELGGVIGAVCIAFVANFLGARHYTRWDWTTGKRYTLTAPTLDTLRHLNDKVEIWVLLGSGDPLQTSVKKMIESYQAETDKLDVHYIDPDQDQIALEDVRKRFRVESGRTSEGHTVTDAIMIVAHDTRHWFLTPSDLFEISAADDTKAKPREEQAITGAIRNVLAGDKVKLCFTSGHGEAPLKEGGDDGIIFLDDILEKDNYENVVVDTTAPNAHDPFKDCQVVLIMAPRAPFTKDETERLKTYLMLGGNAFVATSPLNASTPTGMEPLGIDDALAPFGISMNDDLVLETDPKLVIPETRGSRFIAQVKPHDITNALVGGSSTHDPPRVVVQVLRSLNRVTADGAATPVDLLASSPTSFAVSSIAGAAEWTTTPDKKPQDKTGPFTLAMASERPKVAPSAPHGPRVVVIGSSWVLTAQNWRDPAPVRGAADLVESAISWLAARPEVLDVPERPTVAAGIRITEDSEARIARYVLVLMPLAIMLLGLAVYLWRRSTERQPRKPAAS